jgi:hypothetical protein
VMTLIESYPMGWCTPLDVGAAECKSDEGVYLPCIKISTSNRSRAMFKLPLFICRFIFVFVQSLTARSDTGTTNLHIPKLQIPICDANIDSQF